MRRRAPRPLADALAAIPRDAAPATLLARVQACWPEAVGEAIAAEARPLSERAGTVVIACRSAAWANELELLGPAMLEKVNGALAASGGGQVQKLRPKVAKLP